MSQLTIYNNDPANVTVTVIDGDPPTDQSALVAQLQQQVADLQAKLATALADAQKVVTDLS